MSGKIVTVSDAEFESSVLQGDKPALIDFWAEWCQPCKMLAPTVEEIAGEYEGKVLVGKLNVDDNPATPGKYGIRAIPTLILFKDGEKVDQITGAVGKTQLTELIGKAV